MDERRTFAESVYNRYKDEVVEIFCNTQTGTQMYSDYEVQEQSVIYGKLIGCDGDMLIVSSSVTTPSEEITCEILVNGWSVHSVMKATDRTSVLNLYGSSKPYLRKR